MILILTSDVEDKRNSLEEFEEGLAVLKRTLAEKGARFSNSDWLSNGGSDHPQHQHAQEQENRDRKEFQNNYYTDLSKRQWGKYSKISPGLINIGLGKRTVNQAALRYIGLGKRNMNDAGLKYIGLGKRSISGLKYLGLGKRNFNGVGLKFIGLGKRLDNELDEESKGDLLNTPEGSEGPEIATKTVPKTRISKRCWNRFGSRVCGWRRVRTRGGASTWRYYHKFRRMLVDPKYALMGIGK